MYLLKYVDDKVLIVKNVNYTEYCWLFICFRPGIVDLPADGGVDNADAITLPEIFHDFETAVADLGLVNT